MEENKTNVTETKQEDKGLSQIQPNEKRSWWSIAFIWVGTMICIPMLMVGGIFGSVLTMSSIFWATLIGFAICCTMVIIGIFRYSMVVAVAITMANVTGRWHMIITANKPISKKTATDSCIIHPPVIFVSRSVRCALTAIVQ